MTRKQLIQEIKEAFRGVTLEEGIGLHEGEGIDNYANARELAALRAKDEKENWERISLKDVYGYQDAIYYFDAKGLRFHIPLYLIYELTYVYHGQFLEDFWFDFPQVLKYSFESEEKWKERFGLLNKEQLICIIKYLRFRIAEVNWYEDSPELEASEKLWRHHPPHPEDILWFEYSDDYFYESEATKEYMETMNLFINKLGDWVPENPVEKK